MPKEQHLVVPFTWKANFLPPRTRNPRPILVLDDALVLIPELSPEEFPVAARVSPRERFALDQSLQDLRFDGREFFREWRRELAYDRDRGGNAYETLAFPDMQQRVTGEGHRYFGESPFSRLQNPTPGIGEARRLADHGAGRIVGDNREQRLAEIRAVAAGLRIHGGQVWTEAGEPCWQYDSGGFSSDPSFSLSYIRRGEMPSQPANYCRADRLEAWCDAKFPPDLRPVAYDEIEILMPSAFRLSFEAPALMHVANETCGRIAQYLSPVAVEDFRVYADLRDALAASPQDLSEDTVAAIGVVLASETWRPYTEAMSEAYARWRADLATEPVADAPAAAGPSR